MKNSSLQTDRLFQDRPLPETPRPAPRRLSLELSGLDRSDFLDSALRLFLVACVLISLALCGAQWTAATPRMSAPSAMTPASAAPCCVAADSPSAARPLAL